MTLLDGTEIKVGDTVRTSVTNPFSRASSYRVCTVLELLKGGGVDKAVLKTSAGRKLIRSRYQIKPITRSASVSRKW